MSQSDVDVYAVGLCHVSVCAPEQMTGAEVAYAVQHLHPSGVTPWRISDEPFFADGRHRNPSPCDDTTGRCHWLLVC